LPKTGRGDPPTLKHNRRVRGPHAGSTKGRGRGSLQVREYTRCVPLYITSPSHPIYLPPPDHHPQRHAVGANTTSGGAPNVWRAIARRDTMRLTTSLIAQIRLRATSKMIIKYSTIGQVVKSIDGAGKLHSKVNKNRRLHRPAPHARPIVCFCCACRLVGPCIPAIFFTLPPPPLVFFLLVTV